MADTATAPKPDTANSNGNARPKRSGVQDDFSSKQVGRTNEVLAIWEPEINEILKDKSLAGKVVTYDEVDANVATSLRKHFDLEIAIRGMDRDKKLPNGQDNPNYNKGQLQIRVPEATK